MYDLEAINADQIVTATDRLLLGHPLKRRALARGTADLTVAARRAVVQSDERTVYMRHDRAAQPKIITLLGAAAAAAWLTVALVCLLV
jgi:hypothetical protein